MRRITLCSLRVALLLLIALPLLGGSIVEADDPNELLDGDYAFNYFRSCVQTNQGGFNPDLTLSLNAFARTTAIVGILSYNGDGTASSVHRFRNMAFQAGALMPSSRPVGQGGVTNCTLDYTVDPVDRSFTHQNVICRGTIDTNEDGMVDAEDRPFTITGLMPEGQISEEGETLLLSDPGVAVETITFDPGTADVIIRDRICIHSGTAIKQDE